MSGGFDGVLQQINESGSQAIANTSDVMGFARQPLEPDIMMFECGGHKFCAVFQQLFQVKPGSYAVSSSPQ